MEWPLVSFNCLCSRNLALGKMQGHFFHLFLTSSVFMLFPMVASGNSIKSVSETGVNRDLAFCLGYPIKKTKCSWATCEIFFGFFLTLSWWRIRWWGPRRFASAWSKITWSIWTWIRSPSDGQGSWEHLEQTIQSNDQVGKCLGFKSTKKWEYIHQPRLWKAKNTLNGHEINICIKAIRQNFDPWPHF